MMTEKSLKEQWQIFQLDRVENIFEWYQERYKMDSVGDPLIQYMVLWSVFNALYNTYGLPNNKFDSKNGRYQFQIKFGYKVPNVKIKSDSYRINTIGEKLVTMRDFQDVLNGFKKKIDKFVRRIPLVTQDEDIDPQQSIPIIYKNNGEWIEEDFVPADIRGIASLDKRLFFTEGYIFFQYAAIDDPWDAEGNLIDCELSVKQLLNVLYQLRNNIVHGGSTANKSKEIILDALPILENIVEFIFENRKGIFRGEKDGDV